MKYVPQKVPTYKVNPITTQPLRKQTIDLSAFNFSESQNGVVDFQTSQLKQVLKHLFVSLTKVNFDISEDFDFKGVSSLSDTSQEISIFSVAKMVQLPINFKECASKIPLEILDYYLSTFLDQAVKELESDFPTDFLSVAQELVAFVTFYEDYRKKMACCIPIFHTFDVSQQQIIDKFQQHYLTHFQKPIHLEMARPGNFQYIPDKQQHQIVKTSSQNTEKEKNLSSLAQQLVYLLTQGVEGQLLGSPQPELLLVQRAFSMLYSQGDNIISNFFQELTKKLKNHVEQYMQGYYIQNVNKNKEYTTTDTPVVLKPKLQNAQDYLAFLQIIDQRLAATTHFIGFCFQKKAGLQIPIVDDNYKFSLLNIFQIIKEKQLLVDRDMANLLYDGIINPLVQCLFSDGYQELFMTEYENQPFKLLGSLKLLKSFVDIADSLHDDEITANESLVNLVMKVYDSYLNILGSQQLQQSIDMMELFVNELLSTNKVWGQIQEFYTSSITQQNLYFFCLLVIYSRFSMLKDDLEIKIDSFSNKLIRQFISKFNARYQQSYKFNKIIEMGVSVLSQVSEMLLGRLLNKDQTANPIFEEQYVMVVKLYCLFGDDLLDYIIQLLSLFHDQNAVLQRLFVSCFKRALMFGPQIKPIESLIVSKLQSHFGEAAVQQYYEHFEQLFSDAQMVLDYYKFQEVLQLIDFPDKIEVINENFNLKLSENDKMNLIKLAIERDLKTETKLQLLKLKDFKVLRGVVQWKQVQVFFAIDSKFEKTLKQELHNKQNCLHFIARYPSILDQIDKLEENTIEVDLKQNGLEFKQFRYSSQFVQAWIIKHLKKNREVDKQEILNYSQDLFGVDATECESQLETLIKADQVEVLSDGRFGYVD